jgi:Ca2+-binding RTX toxin-like protein
MPAPTKKTTLSSASFDLNKVGPADYYNATLSGNFVSATAHSRVLTGTPSLQGDTLTATGRNSTLYGGAGKDSLVALGSGNYLAAGIGASTLLGTTLGGALTTLVGNGFSSLIGRAGNDVFIVSEGDQIVGVAGGTDSIRTGINNFSLSDTTRRGFGVQNVQNLFYTGIGGATLTGNALNGSLAGSTTSANSLVSGTGIQTLIGGTGNDTLGGNGKSSLFGGSGGDTYYIRQSGSGSTATFDKVAESSL